MLQPTCDVVYSGEEVLSEYILQIEEYFWNGVCVSRFAFGKFFMNSQPLVTICIPTYNRAEYLKRSLDSLVSQPEFLNGMVEIVISDNASTDNTQYVGEKYSGRYSNVLYFKNKENIADANFPLALSRGNGKLLKLCNDTLLYKQDALKIFCDAVEKYSSCNFEGLQPFLFFSNGHTGLQIPDDSNRLLNFESFLNSVSYWITWIGAFSCWKDDFEKLGQNRESAITHLWQVEQICKILELKNRAVIISNNFSPINQSIKNKDVSYGLYQVFYENYLGILKPYYDRECFSKNCYDFLRKDLLLTFFPMWIANWELKYQKMNYSESENLKAKVIEAYKGEPYFQEFQQKYKKTIRILKFKKFIKPIKPLYIFFKKIVYAFCSLNKI